MSAIPLRVEVELMNAFAIRLFEIASRFYQIEIVATVARKKTAEQSKTIVLNRFAITKKTSD